jgi:hypothetical protein
MDTEVVEQSGPSRVAGGETAAEPGPGAPETTIDEVDRLLDEVEAALTRLDEGTYGVCSGCGTAIDDVRLSGQPTTGTCATCDSEVTDHGRGVDGSDDELSHELTPEQWSAPEPRED